MGNYIATDNAATTLAGSITNSPSVTSITLTDASKFPVVNHGGTGTDWSYVTLFDASNNEERVKVTRRDSGSNTLTIVRGTAAGITGVTDANCRSWSSGTTGVACRLIAQTVNDMAAAQTSSAASAVSAAASASAAEVSAAAAAASANAALPKSGGTMTGDLAMGAGTKIVFEGTTADDFEATIDPGEPTADRTLTLPDKSGTVVVRESITDSGLTMNTAKFLGRESAYAGAIEEFDLIRGSFTAALTGCTTSPTVTVRYQKIGNQVTLTMAAAVSATSNATTKTLTGMPASLHPSTAVKGFASVSDNTGANVAGLFIIGTNGVWNFYANANAGNWTASGTATIGETTVTFIV